jgi:hypothetical protein
MKKPILIASLLGFMVGPVFGQCEVQVMFGNYIGQGQPNNAIINDTNGVPLSGTNYLVDLLYGKDTAHIDQDAGVAVPFFTGIGAGYFSGGAPVLTNGYGVIVAFEVVVWQASAGATWAAATGGGANPGPFTYITNGGTEWGFSRPFMLSGLGDGGCPPPPPPPIAQGPGTLQSFNLVPVPVPQPSLSITSAAPAYTIQWTGLTNVSYNVQATTNFVTWVTLANVPSSQTNFTFTDTNTDMLRFYRLIFP